MRNYFAFEPTVERVNGLFELFDCVGTFLNCLKQEKFKVAGGYVYDDLADDWAEAGACVDDLGELALGGLICTKLGFIERIYPQVPGIDPEETGIRTKAPQTDAAEIRSALESLEWPIGYLDFETLMTAVPLYPDVAPHEQLVTQYSLHVEASPGSELAHREYLADHVRDCREELAAELIRDTAECRTIVVYSSFEKTMIRGLAKLLPTYASTLAGLEAKLFDLEPVVRKGLVHPDFGGRSSIKVVLPVLAPDLSYANLDIADGAAAVAAFAKLTLGQMTDEEIHDVRGALLEYCKLDTLAMVRVLHTLRNLS